MSRSLENLIYSLIDRYMSGGAQMIGNARYHERHAIVTSYDPEKYLAKVMFMPEGQESGWLGVETGHIGDSYGVAVGLQPGDGKKTGDQVIVRFQEGDLESGKVVQRIHSDDEKPPTVQSGEIIVWTKFKKSTGKSGIGDDTTDTDGGSGGDNDEASSGQGGSGQQIYFKNDGTATITDGNGATIVLDGNGNVKITCKKFEVVASDNIGIQSSATATMTGANVGLGASGNIEVQAGGIAGIDGGSSVVVQGGGSVSNESVKAIDANPPIDKFKVLA